jgi:hypothetical protein
VKEKGEDSIQYTLQVIDSLEGRVVAKLEGERNGANASFVLQAYKPRDNLSLRIFCNKKEVGKLEIKKEQEFINRKIFLNLGEVSSTGPYGLTFIWSDFGMANEKWLSANWDQLARRLTRLRDRGGVQADQN